MAARGDAAGLAEQVALLWEALRNLQRLPGATVPPVIPEPGGTTTVTVTTGLDLAVTSFAGTLIGDGDFVWGDPPSTYPLGAGPLTGGLDPFDFSNETILMPSGLYAVTARPNVYPADATPFADSDTWTVTIRPVSSDHLPIYRPMQPTADKAVGHVVWFLTDANPWVTATMTSDTTASGATVQADLVLVFVRLADCPPEITSGGFGP